MQVRTEIHTSRNIASEEAFGNGELFLNDGMKRFFKLFEESTLEGSLAAARKMKKIAKRQPKLIQETLLLHSISALSRFSNSEMLSWPNSPLLVMLQIINPNVLFGQEGEMRFSPLHHLADLTDPFDYSTHVNQLILAKELIERGANVNAVSSPHGVSPLHIACSSRNVTNLDFVEYLLEEGADRNALDHLHRTPLMDTMPFAPGAAKFLLKWPTTDLNMTTRSGACFLAEVRSLITIFSDKVALPDNPDRVQHQFLLKQWRGIEEMMVKRGAVDTGIIILE
jgi:hypothetical protein